MANPSERYEARQAGFPHWDRSGAVTAASARVERIDGMMT